MKITLLRLAQMSVPAAFFMVFSTQALAYQASVSLEKAIVTYQVKADGTYVREYEDLIRVETAKGVAEDSQQQIDYNTAFETIEILEAYTLQPDGRRINVAKSEIHEITKPLESNVPKFSSTRTKVIVYPSVAIGSKLYSKIRIKRHASKFKGHFIESFVFQPTIPFEYYEINFSIEKALPVRFDAKGLIGGLLAERNGKKHYRYIFRQPQATTPEPDSVSAIDYAPYLMATTVKDYAELAGFYHRASRSKVSLTPEIRAMALNLTAGLHSEQEKAKAIYNWVSRNIRYVSVHFGEGAIMPHSASQTLKQRYGDCKDKATLLEALLRASGIESTQAMINSGTAYTLPPLPIWRPINHAITYIPSLELFLDSTAEYAEFGVLPEELLDKPALLVSSGQITQTPKMRASENKAIGRTIISIKEDGSITGQSSIETYGTLGIHYRARRAEELGEDPATIVFDRLASHGEKGTGFIQSTDPANLAIPYTESATFEMESWATIPGPGAITLPFGPMPAQLKPSSDSRRQANRRHPFVCTSEIFEAHYTIKLPKSINVLRIPKEIDLKNGSIRYSASYTLDGKTLYAMRRVEINHSSTVCNSNDSDFLSTTLQSIERDQKTQFLYE